VVRVDAVGALQAFQFTTARNDRYRITREGDRFVARRDGGDFVRRQARIAGVVATTLYDAIQKLGEDPALARDFADVFAYDVDFARGVRRGDEFQILYERLFRIDAQGQERYERPGRIYAARYRTSSGDHSAVYYESENGRGAYYRPDGTPLARNFLIAPLRYEKVTSGYSHARFHPILRYTRPHLGIDYAAPVGTPLWSVADGKVISVGRTGGFGNLIKVRHADGYVSFYSHLSRYAPGLRVGQFVRQKQVIGFVGSSGLATGPHVCFRVSKDGRYVNPAQLKGKTFAASVASNRGFRDKRDALLASLRSRDFVAVEEAL
jgi:murein DD-endopeptidase MepM/ murein hydrolase activator NlpD